MCGNPNEFLHLDLHFDEFNSERVIGHLGIYYYLGIGIHYIQYIQYIHYIHCYEVISHLLMGKLEDVHTGRTCQDGLVSSSRLSEGMSIIR